MRRNTHGIGACGFGGNLLQGVLIPGDIGDSATFMSRTRFERFREPYRLICVVWWEGSFMRQTAFALVFGSFLAVTLSAADQQLVNMLMPDAKIVAGINVDSARNSPLGSFLLNQISTSDPGFQKFVEATGFNPRADLQEILVATTGNQAAPAADGDAAPGEIKAVTGSHSGMHGLILARGTFNVDKISGLAKTDGHQNVITYNGATLLSDPKNMEATAIAFLGTNIAIAGDLAEVKAAIDRRNQANSLDTQVSTKVNSLSASQDAWAVSIVPFSSLGRGAAAASGAPAGADGPFQNALAGDLFKKITETSGGIKFGTQIHLSTELVASDEKNATALGDVVKFLAGMVSMNAGSANGAPPAIVSLLQTMTVETQGNVVNVNLSAPEDQVEGLINAMQTPKAKKIGARI